MSLIKSRFLLTCWIRSNWSVHTNALSVTVFISSLVGVTKRLDISLSLNDYWPPTPESLHHSTASLTKLPQRIVFIHNCGSVAAQLTCCSLSFHDGWTCRLCLWLTASDHHACLGTETGLGLLCGFSSTQCCCCAILPPLPAHLSIPLPWPSIYHSLPAHPITLTRTGLAVCFVKANLHAAPQTYSRCLLEIITVAGNIWAETEQMMGIQLGFLHRSGPVRVEIIE